MSQAIKEFAGRLLLIFISCVFCNAAVFAQACLPGASWCSGTYAYDGAGNIRAIGADTYVYDTAGRLVSGTADVNRTGILSRQGYSYDAFGNRTGASRVAGSVNCQGGCEISPTIDPATNHIISNGAQYDAAGNLTSITNTVNGTPFTSTYDYDALGNMTHATAGSDVRQFIYTADGERIATRNGQSWTWTVRGLDGKVLREFTSTEPNGQPGLPTNPQWAKDYIWRDGLLLATVEPTTPGANTTITRHYHLDHLGTPRVVTNDAGVQIGLHAYYPFGAELNLGQNEQPGELMKFTGHERDLLASNPNTLDYMHARFYNPTVGRFLNVDPIIPTAAVHAPQRWNRYTYVSNNPMRNADPTGKLLEVRAGTCDDKTPCYSKVDTFQAVQNFVGKDASKYLQLGKNGQVTLKGISAANFIKMGGSAAIIGNLIRSTDRTAAFAISSNVQDDRGNATSAFTRPEGGGTLTEINPAAFPTMMGGATQTLDTAMAHDLGGHALMDMWGVSPLDTAFGSIGRSFMMFSGVPASEAFAVTRENEYRATQGMDIREFYFFKGDYNAPPGAPKP
jgi:RHS repeat-associated protein